MSSIIQKRIGVSVIMCCYNSEKRLPETIQHLAHQEVPGEINWEVIIVNNASTDNTTETSYHEWGKYDSKVSFRVVDQPVPGLSSARAKGIEFAQFEYLLFTDDDNWLHKDYVKNSFQIMQSNPNIGALGGVGSPAFEATPPEWYVSDEMQIIYALGEQGEQNGDITDSKGYVYGAGMVLRNSAIHHIKKAGFKHKLMGRFKNTLSSGEDDEICFALRMAGYSIWYDDSLRFKHFIPKNRLQWDYFIKLNEMNSRSGIYLLPYREILRGKREKGLSNNFRWMGEVTKSILKIGRMWKFYRRYLFFGEDQRHAQLRYRRLIGEIKGWLSVRSKYSEIVNHLVDFESELISSKKKPKNYSPKPSIYE